MKKYLAPVALAAFAFVLAYYAYQLVGPDSAKYVAKAKYDAAVKAADAKIAALRSDIAGKEAIIVQKEAERAAALQSAATPSQAERAKSAKIADLERRVAAFESQGDLRAALAASKAECRAWAEKFTLAETRQKDALASLDAAWQDKYDAKDAQYKDALAIIAEKDALLASCNALNKSLGRQARSTSIDRKADLLSEAGISAYSAIRGDFVPLGICIVKEVGVKVIDFIGWIF